MTAPILDYRPSWDDRNRQYAVAPFATSQISGWRKPQRLWWFGHESLDQGSEGACVGFGWTGEFISSPYRIRFNDPNGFARNLYRTAQTVDEWAGEDYEGTSVLAGAKVASSWGLIGAYRWAFSVQEIIDAVLHIGPVVIGIPWFDSMYETRPSGLVEKISNADRMVGGHCLVITGYMPKRYFWREGFRPYEVLRWQNSWGNAYGINRGSGYIRVEDLEYLFSLYGEACVPTTRLDPGEVL